MPRPISNRILELKRRLLNGLQNGNYAPGDHFMSARALATRYSVSYQTAHRLMLELESEGYLNRRAASGTFISGKAPALNQVQLFFHPRAHIPESFGFRLLTLLIKEMEQAGIKYTVSRETQKLAPQAYPVIWELPRVALECANRQHYELLLHDRPEPGIRASFIDSISTDDFSGGVCAAEVLHRRLEVNVAPVVLAGPKHDQRSQARLKGFLSIFPAAKVVYATSWYYDAGMRVARRIFKLKPASLFCANDRLAVAVLDYYQSQKMPPPFLIGFDDAPVAEERGLTTIAIAWDEIARQAVQIMKYRLQGGTSPARQMILSPRPIMRSLL